eukprot:SAG31_NODE_31105_length_372_cov_0.750916_1_plen_32_part_01
MATAEAAELLCRLDAPRATSAVAAGIRPGKEL